MTDVAPPTPGQTLWGDDLNAYLLSLEARIAVNEARIDALETRPDYVYDNAGYQFSNAAPPATGNQVRLNNVDPVLATMIDMRLLDSDGADRSQWIRMLDSYALLRIQDWNDSNVFHRYRVTDVATMDASNAQIPVTYIDGAGTIPNAKVNVAFTVAIPIWVFP